ncbi:hypothetical protein F5146DRAFT_241491 [Armillaria mellea]|nr:hypothetical protein F5146DRAFT_241491 [Armillaria mellea]
MITLWGPALTMTHVTIPNITTSRRSSFSLGSWRVISAFQATNKSSLSSLHQTRTFLYVTPMVQREPLSANRSVPIFVATAMAISQGLARRCRCLFRLLAVLNLGQSSVEKLLTNLISPSESNNYSYLGLDELEGSLGALYASYIWKVWQLCDCPPWPMYSRQSLSVCQDFQLGAATGGWDAVVAAQVTMSETKATLRVILWRAVIGTACSALMCVLSFALLGTMTDRDKDTPLREARLVDGVRLMIDSSLPDTVKLVGVEGLKLRYGWNDDQSLRILDVRDENEKVV